MPGAYQIRFVPSGETREFYGTRGDYYQYADGSQTDVESGPIWCHNGRDFTHGESIETLAEIDRQIADLQDPNSELYRFTKDTIPTADGRPRFRPLYIRRLRRRRRWLMSRVSAPKCLDCGSTEIVVLPLEGERVRNPSGMGWVEVTITGMCSTSFNNRFYTPEGDRIPTETKPTYWTLR